MELRNVATGEVKTESYDKLVLSPGAPSVHPPLPGIDLPGIFHVRTVPDTKTILEWIERGTSFLTGMYRYSGIQMVKPVRRAVVVGGGFIGLEMAENLVHLGFDVTLLQKGDQLLGPLDKEIANLVEGHVTAPWRQARARRWRHRIRATRRRRARCADHLRQERSLPIS